MKTVTRQPDAETHRPPPSPPAAGAKSLADHIIEGAVAIGTLEASRCVQGLFPGHPGLVRLHADLLAENHLLDAAADAYERAAEMFVQADRPLAAVAAKLARWRVRPAVEGEVRRFLARLKRGTRPRTPVRALLARLAEEELAALLAAVQPITIAAGQPLRRPGDEELELFLVAGGTLRSVTYEHLDRPSRDAKAAAILLGEEDCFGDVYPFTETRRSQAFIEALTRAELLRLPRAGLQRLCRRHRNVERALAELTRLNKDAGAEGLAKMIREAGRYENLLAVDLEVFPAATQGYPLALKAFAQDISIGGIRVVLDDREAALQTLLGNYRKVLVDTPVRLGLPVAQLQMKITGRVVWCRPVSHGARSTLALGIRFDDMPPKLRGMFFGFVEGFRMQG